MIRRQRIDLRIVLPRRSEQGAIAADTTGWGGGPAAGSDELPDRRDDDVLLLVRQRRIARKREAAGVILLRGRAQPGGVAVGLPVPRVQVDRQVVHLREHAAFAQAVV